MYILHGSRALPTATILTLTILALTFQTTIADPDAANRVLDLRLRAKEISSAGKPAKLTFKYFRGYLSGKCEMARFQIKEIEGMPFPSFSSPLEWTFDVSASYSGESEIVFTPPIDTSGFKIVMSFTPDSANLSQAPYIVTMVGKKERVDLYGQIDVRFKGKTQADLYGDGPYSSVFENILKNVPKIVLPRQSAPAKTKLPIHIDLDTIPGIIPAPTPEPPDSIEEAETRLWELEKSPNETGSVEYLRHGESWYLRYPNDRKFRVILNPNPGDPDSRALMVTDSLRAGEPGELREEVIVTIKDSTQLELAEQYSRTIKRIHQIRSYIVFLTAAQIELFKAAGIEVKEGVSTPPDTNDSRDSASQPRGALDSESNGVLPRGSNQNPTEDIHFEGFEA